MELMELIREGKLINIWEVMGMCSVLNVYVMF